MNTTKRRALAALATAALAGLAGLVPATSGEDEVPTPGVVDLTATGESVPARVSPPGELVILAISVDQGIVPTTGVLTVTLAEGSAYRDDLTELADMPEGVACDGAGVSVTCTIPEAAVDLELVAHTAPTAGEQVATLAVAATGPLAPLEWDKNNSSTVSTKVEKPEGGVAAGLVEEGDSLSLDAPDGRSYTITVPEGVPGVIVEIRLVDGKGRVCTGSPTGCDPGFTTVFVEDHPVYYAQDPENPLVTKMTFGPQPPCIGLGASCGDIYFAKQADAVVLTKMPYCRGASGGARGNGDALPSSPCVNAKSKTGNKIWFEVLMLSNDPVTLPPALRL